MAHVELKGVTKTFGNTEVIRDVELEIKKGESQDSELGDPVDIENPKTLKSTTGLWPDWLPYGHGAFVLMLLLALLLGYGLPYEKPEQPQRDYRANYESVEEEKKAVKEIKSLRKKIQQWIIL